MLSRDLRIIAITLSIFIQRNPQAFEDVGTPPGRLSIQISCGGNHFAAEIDVGCRASRILITLGAVDHYSIVAATGCMAVCI